MRARSPAAPAWDLENPPWVGHIAGKVPSNPGMKRDDFHDLPSRFHVFGSARGIGAALVAGCPAACDVAPELQDDDPRLELDDEDAVWSEDDDLDDSVGFAEHIRVDSNDNGVIDGMDDLVPIDDPVEIGEMACAGQVFFDPSDGGYASPCGPPRAASSDASRAACIGSSPGATEVGHHALAPRRMDGTATRPSWADGGPGA